MSEPCITCGGEIGPSDPRIIAAKLRFGMPLTPPKRCPTCIWTSLMKFADSPDEETQEPGKEQEKKT